MQRQDSLHHFVIYILIFNEQTYMYEPLVLHEIDPELETDILSTNELALDTK